MDGKRLKLIVGIGNPGRRYMHTRHNVGFDVIDRLAKHHHIRVSRRSCNALTGQGFIANEEVILVKPQTFVNLSGDSVAELAQRLHIPPEDIFIIFDDANLPTGKLRIRPNGSSGGHKGMRSIIQRLHTQEFPRLRIGIGPMRGDAVEHVLGSFSRAELALIRPALSMAADAIESILSDGLEATMNSYNRSQEDD
jgi:peptidyl-tRNA hydrolase, PTH1 family